MLPPNTKIVSVFLFIDKKIISICICSYIERYTKTKFEDPIIFSSYHLQQRILMSWNAKKRQLKKQKYFLYLLGPRKQETTLIEQFSFGLKMATVASNSSCCVILRICSSFKDMEHTVFKIKLCYFLTNFTLAHKWNCRYY